MWQNGEGRANIGNASGHAQNNYVGVATLKRGIANHCVMESLIQALQSYSAVPGCTHGGDTCSSGEKPAVSGYIPNNKLAYEISNVLSASSLSPMHIG